MPATNAGLQKEHEELKKFCESQTHRNLVPILAHGCLKLFESEQQLPLYYIDMELCDQDLSHHIDERYNSEEIDVHGISKLEVWSIMQQLASATKFLQSKEIFIADIKPKNSTSS